MTFKEKFVPLCFWVSALLTPGLSHCVTTFNKTYLKTMSYGTEPFVELAGWAKARRKSELKENGRPGFSIQATGFWATTTSPQNLGTYFSGVPRPKMTYGGSYAVSERDFVDLESESMIRNAFGYNLRYAQNTSTDGTNEAPDIFSMISGQTTQQDHILVPTPAGETLSANYAFGQSGSGPQQNFATNLTNLTNAFSNAYTAGGSVFTSLAINQYNNLLSQWRKNSSNYPAGTVSLTPQQTVYGVRFNVYVNIPNGFFFRLNAPILKVKNNLTVNFSNPKDNFVQYVTGVYSVQYDQDPTPTTANFYDESTDHSNYFSYYVPASGVFTAPATPISVKNANKIDMQTALGTLNFNNNPYRSISGALGTTNYNQNAQDPLKFCKINPKEQPSQFGFGDISLTVGLPVVEGEKFDASTTATLIFGTQKNTGEFLFEPMRGNGGHIGFAIGFEGSVDFRKIQDVSLDTFFLIESGYLFKANEIRTIGAFFDDTTRAPWDRYFLVGKLGGTGALVPLANVTTKSVSVSPGIFVRAVTGLCASVKGCSVDLGWGLWACEAEQIGTAIDYPDNTYAFADPFDYRTYETFSLSNGGSFSPSNNSATTKSLLDWSSAATPAQLVNSYWISLGYIRDNDPAAIHVGFAYNYCHDNSAPRGWQFFVKASLSL